jgi:hypothetical protein
MQEFICLKVFDGDLCSSPCLCPKNWTEMRIDIRIEEADIGS